MNETRSGKLAVVAAGGTGGHLFPAQALAQVLVGRGWRVVLATDERVQTLSRDFPAERRIPLSAATFRRGDFWTWAARADGTVDWPTAGGAAQLMTPHGPVVRYAPIAALVGTQTSPTFEDCRIPFATLTDRALLYRGGDGQSVFAYNSGMVVTDIALGRTLAESARAKGLGQEVALW